MGGLFRLVFGGLLMLAQSNQRDVALAGAVGAITPGIIAALIAALQPGDSGFLFIFYAMPALVAGAFVGAFAGWLLRKLMGAHDLEWAEMNAAFVAGAAAGLIVLLAVFPDMIGFRMPFFVAR